MAIIFLQQPYLHTLIASPLSFQKAFCNLSFILHRMDLPPFDKCFLHINHQTFEYETTKVITNHYNRNMPKSCIITCIQQNGIIIDL